MSAGSRRASIFHSDCQPIRMLGRACSGKIIGAKRFQHLLGVQMMSFPSFPCQAPQILLNGPRLRVCSIRGRSFITTDTSTRSMCSCLPGHPSERSAPPRLYLNMSAIQQPSVHGRNHVHRTQGRKDDSSYLRNTARRCRK